MDIKGPITGSVAGLMRLVAESSAFQTRTGSADQAEAERHVKRWDFRDQPELIQAARPFAAIWPASALDFQQFAGGDANYLAASGALVLLVTDQDPMPRGSREESGDDFAGWIDEVINDIKQNAGRDDRLTVHRMSFLQPLLHSPDWDDPSAGSYWDVFFLVEWR